MTHGTKYAYERAGCKCETCRAGARKREKAKRERRRERDPVGVRAANRRRYASRKSRGKAHEAYRRHYSTHREQCIENARKWQRENAEYYRNQQVKSKQKREGAALETAFQSGAAWSHGEDQFILSNSDLPILEIATALERSYNSVATRRSELRKKGLIT